MPEIDEPNAVDVEVDPNVEGGENESGADNPVVESVFSKWDGSVNDRTKFKDVESLKKSFDESGRRIAELTRYEKAVKQYGIADAQQIPGLMDELLSLRAVRDAAAKAPKVEPKAGPEPTKEQTEIREFLTKELPGLGFITKAQFDELSEKYAALEKSGTQHTEARVQSLIEEGQSTVASFLSDSKIDDPDGEKALLMEDLIRSAIDRNPELEERFFRSSREAKAVVTELSGQFTKRLGWAAPVETTKPNAAAATALAKGKQIVVNKTLPKADSANKGAPGTKPKISGRTDHIRDLGDKAWEEFQAALK